MRPISQPRRPLVSPLIAHDFTPSTSFPELCLCGGHRRAAVHRIASTTVMVTRKP